MAENDRCSQSASGDTSTEQTPASQSTSRGPRILWTCACVTLLVAVLVAFIPVLDHGFVNLDDQVNFLDNPHYRGLGLQQIKWMFSTLFPGHYQPVTWLSHGLDYVLWGMDPRGYHLFSLALHASNAILLCLLIACLLNRPTVSRAAEGSYPLVLSCAAGALFFAVHPLRAESVAWLSERRDVLCGVFYLGTVLAYLRYTATPTARRRCAWYGLSIALFALSLLSKPWGITLPAVLLIIDVYPLRRVARQDAMAPPYRTLTMEKVPYLALAAAAAVLAVAAQGRWGLPDARHFSVIDRYIQAAYGACFYPVKTVLPLGLRPLYRLDDTFAPGQARYLLCACLAPAVTISLVLLRRRWPWALAAWLTYAAIVGPVLGFAHTGPQLVADRYSYFSTMPFAVLVSAGMLRWARSDTKARAGSLRCWKPLACACCWTLCMGIATFRQVRIWRDSESLWTHAIRLDPSDYIALNNRGRFYEERGRLDPALADYDAAIAANPNYARAYGNRGKVRQLRGEPDAALSDYSRAIELDHANDRAYAARGTVRQRCGDMDGARSDYTTAIRINPRSFRALCNRGLLHWQTHSHADAVADFNAALSLKPDYPLAYFGRALTKRELRDTAGATEDIKRALRFAPADWHHRAKAEDVLRKWTP